MRKLSPWTGDQRKKGYQVNARLLSPLLPKNHGLKLLQSCAGILVTFPQNVLYEVNNQVVVSSSFQKACYHHVDLRTSFEAEYFVLGIFLLSHLVQIFRNKNGLFLPQWVAAATMIHYTSLIAHIYCVSSSLEIQLEFKMMLHCSGENNEGSKVL